MIVAELVAKLVADTSGFVQGLREANGQLATQTDKMKQMGESASALGKRMSMSVTLPILAVGAASLKMASDFNTSMSRMVGLAGVAQADIGKMRDTIEEVSHITGVGPQELAESLYFLASSGLDAAHAQDALRVSAMASAAGLGDTATIADAVSSAMNAYGQNNLSAEAAVNALVGAVKLGKGEASEFAGSIGRIIPISAQMGVSFQAVAGALASMTQMGLDANEATTALRGIFTQLLSPSQQSEDALKAVGLSSAGLRQELKDKGLIATLFHLRDAFGGNEAAIAQVFPEVRGLVGMLNLVGSNAKNAEKAERELSSGTDFLGEAFKAAADTPGHKMKVALADVQVAAIKLGDALLPVAAKVASAISSMASWFASLPPGVMVIIGTFGALAAAVGPLLVVFGALARSIVAIKAAMDLLKAMNLAATFASIANPITLAVVAVGALVVILGSMGDSMKVAKVSVDSLTESLDQNTGALSKNSEEQLRNALEKSNQMDDLKRIGVSWAQWTDAIQGNVGVQRQIRAAMIASGEAQVRYRDGTEVSEAAVRRWIRTGETWRDTSKSMDVTIQGNIGLWQSLESQTDSMADAQQRLTDRAAVGADTIGEAGAAAGQAAGPMGEAGAAAAGAAPGIGAMGDEADALQTTLDAAEKAAKALRTEFDFLFGSSLGLLDAEVAASEGLQGFIDKLKDGKATTEETLSAGSAYIQNLEDLREAQAQTAIGTTQANLNFSMQVAAMFNTAKQSGATREELDRLALALKLPDAVRTMVTAPGAVDAKAIVDSLNTSLNGVRAGATANVDVRLGNTNLNLDNLKTRLNNMSREITQGSAVGFGGMVFRFASGGIVNGMTPAIIGEAGPEAVIPLGNTPAANRDRARVLSQVASRYPGAVDARAAGGSAQRVVAAGPSVSISVHNESRDHSAEDIARGIGWRLITLGLAGAENG